VSAAPPLISVAGLSKSFGATLALGDVSFELAAGEVHALIGENGAGKTTLMNVLSGVVQPDHGEVRLAGEPVSISSPRQAQTLGIATVFQELSLTGGVSIAENIFAGRAPSRFGLIDRARLLSEADALLAELGVALDVRRPLAEMPVSVRQMVEIAKAISLNARVLLLDEPTAALNPLEAERLFAVIRRLAARGLGVVYVSHHLSEVLSIADRITVLRDGRVVAHRRPDATDQAGLIRDMVGRELAGWRRQRMRGERRVLLEARGLSREGEFHDVDMTVGAGEIVGLAGLIGSFRGQLGRTLCGLLPPSKGVILLRGKTVRFSGLAQAIRERVAYLPEDRKTDGLFPDLSVTGNIIAASLAKVARHGIYSRIRAERAARSAIARLGIRAPDPTSPVRTLSGGNQQKTLLARWLETDPEIVIVDEPTRGVDVGAKHEIHATLSRLAEAGAGILVISSDLVELIALADRIVVMHAGRIAGELAAETASEEAIVALASGLGEASGRAA
jgi:ABC-type sugar transport system ATPase subunit